jgi:hypothetical protein
MYCRAEGPLFRVFEEFQKLSAGAPLPGQLPGG